MSDTVKRRSDVNEIWLDTILNAYRNSMWSIKGPQFSDFLKKRYQNEEKSLFHKVDFKYKINEIGYVSRISEEWNEVKSKIGLFGLDEE